MSLKCIDIAYLKRRKAPTRKGFFGYLSNYSLGCVVVLVALCQMSVALAAMEDKSELNEIRKEGAPVLGDPKYKHDIKYEPIYGAMDGKSFYLHYCLPDFVPRGLGSCKPGLPGRDPGGVQVNYSYSISGRNVERSRRLEGTPAYSFPFPVNVALGGKTPYFEQYNKAREVSSWKSHQVVKGADALQGKYEGLDFYESPALPGGWWVPKDLTEYRTKLGNPPMFVCNSTYCNLILDQGNGWVVTAIFNEAVLNDWRAFFVQLNDSINIILEQ